MAIYTRRNLPVKRDISRLDMSQVVQEETPVATQAVEETVVPQEETPKVEPQEDTVKKEKK